MPPGRSLAAPRARRQRPAVTSRWPGSRRVCAGPTSGRSRRPPQSSSGAPHHYGHRASVLAGQVKELTRSASPAIIADEISLIKQVLSEHPAWLETPQLRHGLILELIRQFALLDFQSILASPGWRTYLALYSTFSGLTDGELRDQVQAALAHAEAGHVALVARAWHRIADLFGYRLRPELAASFESRRGLGTRAAPGAAGGSWPTVAVGADGRGGRDDAADRHRHNSARAGEVVQDGARCPVPGGRQLG